MVVVVLSTEQSNSLNNYFDKRSPIVGAQRGQTDFPVIQAVNSLCGQTVGDTFKVIDVLRDNF